jgi:probable selenium-dependent hydroxylase accessory protein YqeC
MESATFSSMFLNDSSGDRSHCVAIMGAGGKTSLLFRLGEELSRHYPRVLLTSLTHSEYPTDLNTILASEVSSRDLPLLFKKENPLFLMGSREGQVKLSGISEEELYAVRSQADVCLFECDGARGLSLKAHIDSDPHVPPFATCAIIVVGADVASTSPIQGRIHRPEVFQHLWGIDEHTVLEVGFIARVVTSSQGYGSRLSGETERIYFVNKADTHPREAEQIGAAIWALSGARAYVGSVHAGICQRIE